jgi:serine/threonine protein kinase
MIPTKSLRALALRQHSRQENIYMPQDSILFQVGPNKSTKTTTSSGENLISSDGESNSNNNNNNKSGKRTSPSNSNNALGVDTNSNTNTIVVPERKRPNLKINIQDDVDWIQVSDDEENDEDVGDLNSPRTNYKISKNQNQQSYLFTQSGTIFIDGFQGGIGKGGIRSGSSNLLKIPMRDRLIILCRLGSGASSIVYKALDISTMRLVALKTINLYERSKRRQMVRELNTLFQMLRDKQHEVRKTWSSPETDHFTSSMAVLDKLPSKSPDDYIVDFFDAFSNLDEGGVALMMEYMDGGSLQDIVDHGGCDDEGVLANIALQALTGLAFLHSCGQLHRDLKPANFLISRRGDVKVADLGLAKDMEKTERENPVTSPIPRTNTFVGTATYMSPERIDGQTYSYPADVWSFGLSLMTLALGRLPIDTQGGYWTILSSIRDSPPPKLPDSKFSPECCDFLNKCLIQNPAERYTCEQLLGHKFLEKAVMDDDIGDEESELRSVEELENILAAMVQHIRKTKSAANQSFYSSRSSNTSNDNTDNEFSSSSYYQQLRTISIPDFLRYLLLRNVNEEDGGERQCSTLQNLANQVHLSSEKAVKVVKAFCDSLREDEDEENFISTPKASHSSAPNSTQKPPVVT